MYSQGVFSCLLLLLAASTDAYTTFYHRHQVWRLENITASQTNEIRNIIDTSELDVFASGPDWVDVRLPPNLLESLWAVFNSLDLIPTIIIEDLQSLIDNELQHLPKEKSGKIIVGQYNQLEDIEAYMQEVATSNEWVTVESIGKTYEGRDLWVNKLAVPGDNEKPSIWIDCGIHPREWISTAICVYGLDYLTVSYSVVDEVTQLLDTYDIYMMPVHNPDGYYYTWHNDRFWRKNRGPTEQTCTGIDLNRNFDDGNWGGEGTSDNPCNEFYKGSQGFSELETQAVRDYTSGLMDNNNLTAFFTIHSYGQMWMFPYGWTNEIPPDFDALYRVSEVGINAIKEVHSTPYFFGSFYNVLYPAAGTSADWAYSQGVVHAYTLELRDTGSFGFMLPDLEILPCAEETWHGLIQGILAIQDIDKQIEEEEELELARLDEEGYYMDERFVDEEAEEEEEPQQATLDGEEGYDVNVKAHGEEDGEELDLSKSDGGEGYLSGSKQLEEDGEEEDDAESDVDEEEEEEEEEEEVSSDEEE